MARFFHTPKPRTFDLKPRYYDPEKEEREKKIRRLKAKHGVSNESETYQPTLTHGEFKRGLSTGKFSMSNQRRKSNIRLLVLIVLLSLLVYYVFI